MPVCALHMSVGLFLPPVLGQHQLNTRAVGFWMDFFYYLIYGLLLHFVSHTHTNNAHQIKAVLTVAQADLVFFFCAGLHIFSCLFVYIIFCSDNSVVCWNKTECFQDQAPVHGNGWIWFQTKSLTALLCHHISFYRHKQILTCPLC